MQKDAACNSLSISEEHMEYKEKTIGKQIYRKSIKHNQSMDEGET